MSRLPILVVLALIFAGGCAGGGRSPSVPRADLRPFKEISAIEIFEKVLHGRGHDTARKKPIYVVGYGEWQIDLWVEGERIPLVIEYLTSDDREELGGSLKSSKAGEKFKLVAVAVKELAEGEEISRANSRLAVVFDDRDYVYQPNPRAEDRQEVTILEIERRLKKDITDVAEELERVMAEEGKGEEEEEGEEEE